MNPRASVVISTYNRPEMLKRAIESVQAQTFKDWELIVAEDGAEGEGLGDYPNLMVNEPDRYRLTIINPHFGCDTLPKNRGIKEAKGELIALLDDDNTWRPDHLQSLVKCLDDNPQIDVAYGDRYLHDETNPKNNGIGFFHDFNSYLLMQRNYIDTSDVLVRKAALQYVGGFDERYRKYVDWNLWIRLDKAGYHFKHVPLVLTDYYLHEGSKQLRKEDSIDNMPAWNPIDLEIRLPFLGPVKPPRVAIFSLTYDRLAYTKACFDSLYKTAGFEFDHYVVDNGSTDGTGKWLIEWQGGSDTRHIRWNSTNWGISKASNQALDLIADGYDIIGKVDNDCMFLTEGWLRRIVQLWERNHRMAFSPYVQGLRDNPGGATRQAYGSVDGELLGLTKHLGGICVFSSAKAYDGFRFDEEMPLHGVQDVEFSQHLNKIGFQPAYLENFFVEHYRGTDGQEQDYPEYFKRRKAEKSQRYEESK